MRLEKPLTKAQIHALFASQERVPHHDRRSLPTEELVKGFQDWFASNKTAKFHHSK